MKKISMMLVALFLFIATGFAQQAKYVFYFIGDGMGVNQVNATEMYRGELDGKIGTTPLLFTQFPSMTVATTFAANNGVTDSAASGTALATGHKTKYGTIGMLEDQNTPANSIAVWAKKKGAQVGISTSVSVDHATPAAFYAHQPDRGMYYEIGNDLIKSNVDFFAASDFLLPQGKDGKQPNLYELVQQAGYTIYRGYDEYVKGGKKDKVILFQPKGGANRSIPYAIDRKPGDMSLQQIVKAGIDFFSKDLSKGFFFMVEGGEIDWACHSNDAATVFHEIIDMDEAIKEAYEFYLKHPDETLIVVTADHETGGITLGIKGKSRLNLKALASQKMSEKAFTELVNNMRKETGNKVSWEMIQQALKENFGFWDTLELSEAQEARLKNIYNESFGNKDVVLKESEYQKAEPIAAAAKEIISEIAWIGWTTGGHTAGFVPVTAIGAGAELFHQRTDNAEIPRKIAKAAGYEAE